MAEVASHAQIKSAEEGTEWKLDGHVKCSTLSPAGDRDFPNRGEIREDLRNKHRLPWVLAFEFLPFKIFVLNSSKPKI